MPPLCEGGGGGGRGDNVLSQITRLRNWNHLEQLSMACIMVVVAVQQQVSEGEAGHPHTLVGCETKIL